MKKKNKKYSKEDHLLDELKDFRKKNISEPTRKFEIGERVIFGAHEESRISEIFDDGKIYKIHTKSIKKEYNNDIIVENDLIVTWFHLFPYKSIEEYPPRISKDPDHFFDFMHCSISGLFNYWYHFGIDTEMDYQRPLVWDLKDKRSLLDSVFNHIEIGKFAMVFKGYGVKNYLYEMLDGKQRLNALIDFFEDRYTWKGLYFSQLHPRDKNHFDSYSILIATTRQPLPEVKKYEYFLKLNTQGKPQDQKHLQKVLDLYKKHSKDL
jgi:hypothetical protein